MGEAFKDSDPPILLADLSTETGRNIQAGYGFLFMGAVTGIRNPDAHEQFEALDAKEALETLAFAMLMRRRQRPSAAPNEHMTSAGQKGDRCARRPE